MIEFKCSTKFPFFWLIGYVNSTFLLKYNCCKESEEYNILISLRTPFQSAVFVLKTTITPHGQAGAVSISSGPLIKTALNSIQFNRPF